MLTPLIIFMLSVSIILGGFFALSYLVWSDRAKTPEAIAAELSMFTEQLSYTMVIVGACLIISVIFFVLSNFLASIN